MANEDSTFLIVGAYASVEDARADYQVVKDLHAEKVVGGFDAAVITKDDKGKVHVNKDETATRKGAWGGAGVGALVGLIFPPALIGSAAVGAAVGAFGGHLSKGMSRSDMKDLGDLLEAGEAGLVVIGDWRLEERIDELMRHAERRQAKELRDIDRAETEEQIGDLMSGQGILREHVMLSAPEPAYGQSAAWHPERPRWRLFSLVVSWLATGAALMVAAALLPGVRIDDFWGALLVAAIVAALNAVIPPVLAALRLPLTLVLGFLLVLIANAVMLQIAANVTDGVLGVNNFGWALLAALVVAAVSLVLAVVLGASDDASSIRIAQRIARRQGTIASTDVPGIVFLEIDGLALPVLRRAMRDGYAPSMARWLADDTHRLVEWETDLSSQTGASQAGILLGSNEDIPAFRWVEKETATLMTCSAPPDCAEIERRHASGVGLLVDGGASRGNLLSGEADEVILTVSRMEAEKRSNPGYRAFLANGDNVTRTLVLFGWEVILEWAAALRAIRRDVRPRGHRGGIYPLMRGALCVFVRDLIVSGVLTDMMRGRPAVYATFSSYDEVAHHSGLERADTREALRKLDDQFGHIERARRYAPRPYQIIVLSDHGQTQGATFKQRNGLGLDELVERSLSHGDVSGIAGGDEQSSMVGHALSEATGTTQKRPKNDVSDRDVVVLGSGNLGLVYLMEERRRLSLEEIEARHPKLVPTLRTHPHVGWLLVRSSENGAVALGPRGAHYLADGRIEGEDPLAPFSPNAPRHLLRTDGFPHVADIMVGSFYDPELDEGCAFEELICFHGGIGGLQTRPFILYPAHLEVPPGPIVGAASVHAILAGWRQELQAGPNAPARTDAGQTGRAGAAQQPV